MAGDAGYLVGFPYKETQGKLLIRKDKQRKNLSDEFCSATMCCKGKNKGELAYKVSVISINVIWAISLNVIWVVSLYVCLLYTSPSPRDKRQSRMPSSA